MMEIFYIYSAPHASPFPTLVWAPYVQRLCYIPNDQVKDLAGKCLGNKWMVGVTVRGSNL